MMCEEPGKSAVLEAIDREIAFYRHRAGQVFFVSLAVEVLILAGRERIALPKNPPWLQPLAYGMLFVAVAVFGILLGREYRERIHDLKNKRSEMTGSALAKSAITLSEIEMLYVVLVFLSSAGLIAVWLNAFTVPPQPDLNALTAPPQPNPTPASHEGEVWYGNRGLIFWMLFVFSGLLAGCGILFVSARILSWLKMPWFLGQLIRLRTWVSKRWVSKIKAKAPNATV